jgi:hypothetical protein
MNQQHLRALIVLLASIALMPWLAMRPDVERTGNQAVARRPDDSRNSLRLDTFERGEDIIIPPVPPPDPSFERLTGGIDPIDPQPGYFASPVRKRTAIPGLESLVDCEAEVPGHDDIVIPPVPPPKAKARSFSEDMDRYEKAILGNGPREFMPRAMPQSISPCSICGKYH